MKIQNPRSRNDLSIKRTDRVLEVGPGNFPHPRANVLVEKYIDTNYHRSGNLKVLNGQELICADGENLPFDNLSFDYVICCHVLEHVDQPIEFLAEQARVSARGYIETPSLIGEYLMPKESHKWVLQEIDNKIIMYTKDNIGFLPGPDLGYIFQSYLPKQSIGYKILQRTHASLTNVTYEWKDNIEVLINPDSSKYRDFFTKPIDETFCNNILSKKDLKKEAGLALWALADIIKSVVSNTFKR